VSSAGPDAIATSLFTTRINLHIADFLYRNSTSLEKNHKLC
jgi:hypothetical protein